MLPNCEVTTSAEEISEPTNSTIAEDAGIARDVSGEASSTRTPGPCAMDVGASGSALRSNPGQPSVTNGANAQASDVEQARHARKSTNTKSDNPVPQPAEHKVVNIANNINIREVLKDKVPAHQATTEIEDHKLRSNTIHRQPTTASERNAITYNFLTIQKPYSLPERPTKTTLGQYRSQMMKSRVGPEEGMQSHVGGKRKAGGFKMQKDWNSKRRKFCIA